MDIVTGKDINNLQFTICNLRKFGNEDITVGYYKKYGIKIWGLDIVNPDKDFSVAHFVEYTEIAIEDITKRGKLPIIVGGTGLYIKAITDGIETVNIPRNEKLRNDLATKTVPELQEILQDVNSQKYASMNGSDRKNPRRLIRAIEVARFERKPVHYERTEFHSKNLVNVLVIGLSATKERLHKRIDDRVAKRIKHGAVEETKRLLNSGYNENLQSMSGIGYGELVRYVKGTISSQEAIEKWRREEYKYCRRQLTWFKKDKRIKWIDITEKNWHQELEKIICRWYNLH
jgi:tRNA dimethylallyltransferase